MSDILSSIREGFNKGYFGKAMSIEHLPKEYPAWTIKTTQWVGVAIPTNNYVDFSETFSNAEISTEKKLSINNIDYDVILLKTSIMDWRNEFAIFCSNFVDSGDDGALRKEIIENPKKWWENWKNLIGNASVTKTPYSVLGELVTLNHLLKSGKNVKWSGIENATHDIEAEDFSVEVKSTISRYGYTVTISSTYQLHPTNNKPLYLSFIRFEESDLGESIEDILVQLKGTKIDIQSIEKSLEKVGLAHGRTARSKKYKILEWKKYKVDKSFPAITEDSFKDGHYPENLLKFVYTIDLSGIKSENVL